MPMPSPVGLSPEAIANFFPELNQYMRKLLEGGFLDQGNPYVQSLIQNIEEDANRAYLTGTVPLVRSNLNMSGAYGSALGSLAESRASQDFTRGLMGTLAQTRTGLYESERDRMMQGLQLYSGETIASRQGLFGARDTDVQSATNIRTAQIAAAAQKAAARMAANAARYGADRSYAASRLGAQGDYWNNLFNYSQLLRSYTGGPQDPIGQRPPPPFGDARDFGVRIPGYRYKRGPDPWNDPGGLF